MAARVAVTGLGVVSPIGVGSENFWRSLEEGRSGVSHITKFEVSESPVQIAAEVGEDQFDPVDYVRNRKWLRLMSRPSQFAVAAAQGALEDSGLELSKIDPFSVGVSLGSAPAAESLVRHGRALLKSHDEKGELSIEDYWEAASKELDPLDYLRRLPNMPSCHLAIANQIYGPNNTIATACSAGTQALGDAFHNIQRGDAKVMLAGGTDCRINPEGLVRFALLGALSRRNECPEQASRPFDANRDGFVIGEGAGVVVLEDMEFARRRGAHIHAELVGFGASSDAFRLTDSHPEGRGAVLAMTAALREAGIEPDQVDYINAHGTSTRINDRTESLAIRRVFENSADRVAVSSTKSMTGHLISAAGAVEFVACALAIRHGVVPPTINYEAPDNDCDLDYVPNEARQAQINVAMSNSFGFGGQNSVIVMKRV